jgi:hypothetical protein
VRSGHRLLKVLAVATMAWCSLAAAAATAAASLPLSGPAAELLAWVVRSHDNQAMPFMIIDKQRAHLWVFDRAARLSGDAPVLLGMARGDHTAPGVGDMKLSEIKWADRTTPAGRFLAERGINARGENVVWVDYDAGVSMHPVLTTNAKERRAHRLATPTPDDNRVSYGCVNVPKGFFANVVLATVHGGNSIVYILPETLPVRSVFGDLTRSTSSAPPQ